MQTRSQQYAVLASVALMLGLAACGSDSTGPKGLTPAQLAEHFDSIYSADLAAGTAADSNAAEYVAAYVEVDPAFGGSEASFSSSGTSWMGVGFALTDNTDTAYVTAVYPNRDLQTAIVVVLEEANGVHMDSAALGTTDGFQTTYSDSTVSGSVALQSVGSACSEQSGLAAEAALTLIVGNGSESCASAKWQESFAVTFESATGVGAVSGSNVTISGPFFTESGGSRIVAIPTRAAAAVHNLVAHLHHAR
jgi:hypothetical protein